MSSLSAIKAQGKSRESRERKALERKRCLLVQILRYLCDNGYVESYQKLCRETNLSLSDVDVADNVDLNVVFQDFEDAYELKYGRKPKFVRRVDGKQAEIGTQNSVAAEQSVRGSHSGPGRPRKEGARSTTRVLQLGNTNKTANRAAKADCPAEVGTNSAADSSKGVHEVEICVEGQSKKLRGRCSGDESEDDQKEISQDDVNLRLLRPLPESLQGDLKELVQNVTRDIHIESPDVRWEDVIGLEAAKQVVKEAVVMPTRYPHYFTGLLAPWKAILLYGPPGTGKTMLAKAVATECRTTFFNISASSIISKWRGDSEKLVRVLFELARNYAPSTVFLDEVDALMTSRGCDGEHEASRRMKTELLIQLDGLARSTELVFVLAATNLPWELDAALLRRLEKKIFVPLPGLEARERILHALLNERASPDVQWRALAERMEGYSGSDVALVAKEAAMRPLRRLMAGVEETEKACPETKELEKIGEEDMIGALGVTKSSSQQNAAKYRLFSEKHGQTA